MNILGLHLGHDATAALIKDNRLVSIIERERLTRKKYDRGFNPQMVDECLKLGNIDFNDLDYVTISLCSGDAEYNGLYLDDYWGITLTKNKERYRKGPRQLEPWEYEDGIIVKFDGIEKPAFQIQHHIAHAAASYYLSSWDKATALTYDGSDNPWNQSASALQ